MLFVSAISAFTVFVPASALVNSTPLALNPLTVQSTFFADSNVNPLTVTFFVPSYSLESTSAFISLRTHGVIITFAVIVPAS